MSTSSWDQVEVEASLVSSRRVGVARRHIKFSLCNYFSFYIFFLESSGRKWNLQSCMTLMSVSSQALREGGCGHGIGAHVFLVVIFLILL